MAPQIEESNATWVGLESEWLPLGSQRLEARPKEDAPTPARVHSVLLARLAAGYLANEAVVDSAGNDLEGRRLLGGAGVYEANMRVVSGTSTASGGRLDVVY